MSGDVNLERLKALRGGLAGMLGGTPAEVPAEAPAGAPPEEAPPAPPDPAAPAAAPGVAPPEPGAPPLDTEEIPAEEAPSAIPSFSLGFSLDDDEALSPIVEKLYTDITTAESPESAQALLRDFLRNTSAGLREEALAQFPKYVENLEAATKVWEEAAAAMLKEHPHLEGRRDLLEVLVNDEYGKDAKRSPKDLYAAVAKRANDLLQLQEDKPSLPAALGGSSVSTAVPTGESDNDKRLRELRERLQGGRK